MLDLSYDDGRLVFKDPKLPHLATVMDVGVMVEHFDKYLHASGLDHAWEVTKCATEKVYYRHTKSCGVLYRLTLRHVSGREIDEWFYGRMYPPGSGYDRFERVAATVKQNHNTHDFLQAVPPVSFWQDFNMALWVFPQDPELVTLPEVVDPAFVRQCVEANLQAFDLPENEFDAGLKSWRCTGFRYDRVKYMPGKRCVLRYHVNLTGPAGEFRELTFYTKIYNNGTSRYHFDMLQLAYQQLSVPAATINIPKPLLHHDGLNTFWQAEWKGKALIDVITEYDWAGLFPKIATVLAAMHRHRVAGLHRGPNVNEVLTAATDDAAKLVHLLPPLRELTATIIENLEAAKTALEKQDSLAVPIHGACRLEQMLIRGDDLALVDFDAVTLGDPMYDVAEFIASLQYLELSRSFSRERLIQATEIFYDSYTQQVPWPCDRRRLAWYALAFLITKLYSSAKNLDGQALPKLDSAGQEICEGWLKIIAV